MLLVHHRGFLYNMLSDNDLFNKVVLAPLQASEVLIDVYVGIVSNLPTNNNLLFAR